MLLRLCVAGMATSVLLRVVQIVDGVERVVMQRVTPEVEMRMK